MSSIGKIEKKTSNRFLNFYEFEAIHRDGKVSPYYVSSRAKSVDELKAVSGKNNPDGICNLTVSNVIYNSSRYAVHVKAFVKNATFTNIVSTRSTEPLVLVDRENGLVNAKFENLVARPGVPTIQQL